MTDNNDELKTYRELKLEVDDLLGMMWECDDAEVWLDHNGGGQSAWHDVTDQLKLHPPSKGKRLWLIYECQPVNHPPLYALLKWLSPEEVVLRIRDTLFGWRVVKSKVDGLSAYEHIPYPQLQERSENGLA